MIQGEVTGLGREGRVCLRLQGPRRKETKIEAVIDTGYTAFLTLPPAVIAALGFRWKTFGRGILADGSVCLFDVYVATVIWDGEKRRVLVDAADTDPLIGMALLSGYELRMQIRPRGKIRIERLPKR